MSSFVLERPWLPLRVVLSASAVLQREGLARILSDRGHQVFATVGEPAGLRSQVERHRPDIAVIFSGTCSRRLRDALQVAVEIRGDRTGVPVLVLAPEPADRRVAQMLCDRRGGFGYLLWDRIDSLRAFTDAIETVATGGVVTGVEALTTALRPRRGLELLTAREHQVLALVARGLSNVAIARELTVTVASVEKHIKRVLAKLELKTTANTHRRVLAALAYHGQCAAGASFTDQAVEGSTVTAIGPHRAW
jgi:DNA-binding NarL/FixJ family response regulator